MNFVRVNLDATDIPIPQIQNLKNKRFPEQILTFFAFCVAFEFTLGQEP